MLLEFACQRFGRVKVHPVVVAVAKVHLGAPALNASLMVVSSVYTAGQGPMRGGALDHLSAKLSDRRLSSRFIHVLIKVLNLVCMDIALAMSAMC